MVDQVEIIESIRSLPAMDTLRILSMIDIAMESTNEVGATELKLLRIVQDGRFLYQALIDNVLKRSTTLFHRHLRLALTQLVLKYCDFDMCFPHEVPTVDVWEKVLSLILQLADCVRAQGNDPHSLKSYLIQSLQFASEENWSSQLLRTYEQYVHVAPTVPQDLDHGLAINLDYISINAFGTELRELFANEFVLFIYLQKEYHDRSTLDSLPTTAYVGKRILEQNVTLSKLLCRLSGSFINLKEAMHVYSFDQLLWPTQELKRTPFLQLSESVFMPLSLMYFAGRMGGGMYYSLIENVPARQRRQFQNYIGRVFEGWAVSEIRRVYPDDDRVEFFERDLPNSQNQKRPEAVSIYPQGNIVWECKTKRLTSAVYESGNLEKYEGDLLEGIGKGILQTYSVAQQIADEVLLKDKILNKTCLPVIVTLEAYPLYGFLREEVVKLHQDCQPGNALTPLVLSSYDFYLLCDFSITRGLNIWTTLGEWSRCEIANGNSKSLNEFLVSRYGKPELNAKQERFMAELRQSAESLYGF